MRNKFISALLTTAMLFNIAGCKQNTTNESINNEVSDVVVSKDGSYEAYASLMKQQKDIDSITMNIERSDDRSYDGGSLESFDLHAVFEAESLKEEPTAHSQLDIYSNGLNSKIESYFYNGRLYNTFNGVDYYDDSTFDEYKKTMLVKIEPTVISQSDIESIKLVEGDLKEFEFILNKNGAKKYYQSYVELEEIDTDVLSALIKDTFDTNGNLVKEESTFKTSVDVQGITVKSDIHTSVDRLKINETSVRLNEKHKDELNTFVYYKDIDTSSISDYDPSVDQMEDSVVDTLKKRLVNRMHYELQKDGTYKTEFNDHESYVFDFEHNQFIWTRYSNTYVYNWKADVGGFESACNFNFKTDQASSGCNSDVLEMVKSVKTFLEMELYYCGISLTDLVDETK